MKTIKSVLPKAGMIFLIFTLLCGVIYTGVVTGIAQLIFPDNAGGSIIEVDGKKYGCELLGQQYTDEVPYVGAHYEYRCFIPIRMKTERR